MISAPGAGFLIQLHASVGQGWVCPSFTGRTGIYLHTNDVQTTPYIYSLLHSWLRRGIEKHGEKSFFFVDILLASVREIFF